MYRVQVDNKVEKQIDRLPETIRERVLRALRELRDNPRPGGVKKMRGYDRRYRIRVGDYRVVYEIFDDQLLVIVIEAGHRRHVYR